MKMKKLFESSGSGVVENVLDWFFRAGLDDDDTYDGVYTKLMVAMGKEVSGGHRPDYDIMVVRRSGDVLKIEFNNHGENDYYPITANELKDLGNDVADYVLEKFVEWLVENGIEYADGNKEELNEVKRLAALKNLGVKTKWVDVEKDGAMYEIVITIR